MSKNRWTPEQTALCFALYRRARPLAEIAAVCGHSPRAVGLHCALAGVRRPYRQPQARWALIRQRWLDAFRQPHTIEELAERFGCTPGHVKTTKRRLRKLGYMVPTEAGALALDTLSYPDHRRPARCHHGSCDGECSACEREQRKDVG